MPSPLTTTLDPICPSNDVYSSSEKKKDSDVYKIDVVPDKNYMLRQINARFNMENFSTIANHKMTIVEADAEYTKQFAAEAYTLKRTFKDDSQRIFLGHPSRFYDFVNEAPNNAPNNTRALNGTKTKVIEYGTSVQIISLDTGTVSTENHPIDLHGYRSYVTGFGTGKFNPQKANSNLVDPPYMNNIGVTVGGWAAIRFVADNPWVWLMHCHIDVHQSWGLGTVLIVKNGVGELETTTSIGGSATVPELTDSNYGCDLSG
ncbi:hypothetical protein SLEP1_g24181 [Rubroshorea leprosula]|uniref:Laccase n=1 Tax=Rubroshorea leprosula TaxID=152421 RepID=A0AAV5JF20_9ROSI|nr:hypothetical protein SLEP1_g24181 [Rubroshorea leprosula]